VEKVKEDLAKDQMKDCSFKPKVNQKIYTGKRMASPPPQF
jgi:hypothetical protein